VDAGGAVFTTGYGDGRVLKLSAGATNSTALPFAGLMKPWGISVDGAGNVYVVDGGNNRVLELRAK
jgi:serine/threonine-protein kinase